MRSAVRILLVSALVSLLVPALANAKAGGFSFGVAAGEVTSHSAKLWGRADRPGATFLQVSTNSSFGGGVEEFLVVAKPPNDFTVQREVDGLTPGTQYWYRFKHPSGDTSDVGTFVTAPNPNADATIHFGWTGDQDATPAVGETQPYWNNFDIFRRMQEENNQFNIDLGDTIYSDSEVPGRLNPVALTVPQKWEKYKTNLAQPKLSSLRGSAGFYSHWDDHEFVNDFSRFENVFSSATVNGEFEYGQGVKAFTDYAPVDFSPGDGLYRTERWGKNLELFFLDERSFRSAKASANGVCDNPQTGQPDLAPTAPQDVRGFFGLLVTSLREPVSPACLAAINDPNRTMLGSAQEAQFLHDIQTSDARFKVVMNEVPIQQFYANPYDRWEGYAAERERILRALQGVKNVVFLTTDVHATLVNDARFQTLESGGPVNSGITDITVGPAATANFALEIDQTTGMDVSGLIDSLFFERQPLEPQPPRGVGMRCSILDQFSYGEVSVTGSTLTVTPKDINGKPQTSNDGPCGPFFFAYQP